MAYYELRHDTVNGAADWQIFWSYNFPSEELQLRCTFLLYRELTKLNTPFGEICLSSTRNVFNFLSILRIDDRN